MAKRKSPRTHSAEFKLNVVLEAYANGNFSDTAARHGIHITQINNWKRQLLTRGKEIFEYGQASRSTEQRKIDQMERTIGRLALQNDILKKTQELLG